MSKNKVKVEHQSIMVYAWTVVITKKRKFRTYEEALTYQEGRNGKYPKAPDLNKMRPIVTTSIQTIGEIGADQI